MTASTREGLSEDERRRRVEAGGSVLADMHKGCDTELIAWAKETGRFTRIDRRSQWGCPYKIKNEAERLGVIERYRQYLAGKPELLADLDELRGKVLGCWCYPKPCHGNVLLEHLERG
jgi:hypothetical protein